MLNTYVLKMGWEVLLEGFWNRKQLSDSGGCLCDHTHQSSQHGYMNWVWPLCYRAGCAITKYHRLVALTIEICFLTTLEAGSLRPNVDRVDVCWELPLGAPFQCVLTRSFLGDSAGGKSEGDGSLGQESYFNKAMEWDYMDDGEMVAGFMRGGAKVLESRLKSSPWCGRDQGRQVKVSEQRVNWTRIGYLGFGR